MKAKWLALFAGLLFSPRCEAQQTILNVPSADVLARGKVYFELDTTVHTAPYTSTWSPRLVFGVGHDVEVGINISGLSDPEPNTTTLTPTVKWRLGQYKGWSLLAGDHVFMPVERRPYDIGNYVYVEAARTFFCRTRLTVGAYDFSAGVVARKNRAGAQLGLEHTLTPRISLVSDWYSGAHASGYLSAGALVKVSRRLTIYPAYMIGNRGLTNGNHQFEFELGWNFN
jgi:hypothetical protein